MNRLLVALVIVMIAAGAGLIAATLQRLRTYALVLGAATVVLIVGVHLLVLVKNVSEPGTPPIALPIAMMGAAIVGMTVAAIVMKRRFRRVQ